MTKPLEEAFAAASRLPAAEQDALAAAIRAELEADPLRSRSLAQSQDALGRLADEALKEHQDGRTKLLDPDER